MTQLRIGASTWIWESPATDVVIEEVAAKLAGWGFDLIELPVEQLGDWSPRKVIEVLKTHGLGATVCAVMPSDRDLSTTEAATVASTQEYLRRCVDLAADVGSKVVAGPIYAPVGKTWLLNADERDEVLSRVAANLLPVATYAAEHGVALAVEPLNRYETSLINTLDQAIDLVDRVDSAGIGILADAFHMNIEERDVGAAIERAGNRIVHVQVAGNDRGTPGGDQFSWDALAKALRTIGYSGAVCIESFTVLNQTIARAAAVWRPLAATQDHIAADGLPFLRTLFA